MKTLIKLAAAIALLVGVGAIVFGFVAFWTWLVMLAAGALGVPAGFWSCIPAGLLVAFISGSKKTAEESRPKVPDFLAKF